MRSRVVLRTVAILFVVPWLISFSLIPAGGLLAKVLGNGPQTPASVRFAVVGDYGWQGQPEADVSSLIHSWNPDMVITTGDNNYDSGAASTIDQNIGQYYHDYIYPYTGGYGSGAPFNQFFPTLGNHDWDTTGAAPYLSYFTLPGNERYYDYVQGPVHFFVVDSDPREPDGITSSSTQGLWLQGRLAAATEPWKLVYFHHPPYSSGSSHGNTPALQWPFQAWGATAVLSGHEHNYERIIINNFPYFVDGLGGRSIYGFGAPIAGSVVRYNANYGAMLVDASSSSITFKFYARPIPGTLIDTYTINAPTATPTSTPSPTWTATQTPIPIATDTPIPAPMLVGHVTWQGRSAQPSTLQQLPITLSLKSETTEVNYANQTTGADGTFTVSTQGLAPGSYSWRVKGAKYLANSGSVTLSAVQAGIAPQSPLVSAEMGLMLVGDCNNDNSISVADFNILKGSFGKSVGDPGYDDRAEFTGDNAVSISDFSLLRGNFAMSGAPPIRPHN